jgi:hypothetical protein
MNMEKVRVYSVAVMAFSQLHEKAPARGTYVESLPALIPAGSIGEAAELAKSFAFKQWPINETWYGHQASIEPVTKQFFEIALEAYSAGAVDLTESELPNVFQFDT